MVQDFAKNKRKGKETEAEAGLAINLTSLAWEGAAKFCSNCYGATDN